MPVRRAPLFDNASAAPKQTEQNGWSTSTFRLVSIWAKAKELENQEIDRMPDMNHFEQAQTERESPVVFLPKKDGIPRFWVYYRTWIALPIRNSY